ncbi:MAG: DUF4240 domain-containing protein [Bacteroidota bacterium]
MTSSFKIAVKNLDQDFIKAMQEKYKDAELEITIKRPSGIQPLEEETFWNIIDQLDWEATTDDGILAPAIEHLSSLSIAHIYGFEEILSKKLYHLDQQKFAAQIGKRSFQADRYFSVDTFLYARACVVANGKAAYDEVVAIPEAMPKDLTFEPILYLAAKAYEKKTGKSFLYIPTYSYETYSNEKG